jgi:hypothetical protein
MPVASVWASCLGWWSDEACSPWADSPEINIDAVKNCLCYFACTSGNRAAIIAYFSVTEQQVLVSIFHF